MLHDNLLGWCTKSIGFRYKWVLFLALVLAPAKKSEQGNKKVLQQDANRPLANRKCFIMKTFEHVRGSPYSEIEDEQV